jgi:aspartyl/asparaginyl beta-hydroxylase (cupin superfamily)
VDNVVVEILKEWEVNNMDKDKEVNNMDNVEDKNNKLINMDNMVGNRNNSKAAMDNVVEEDMEVAIQDIVSMLVMVQMVMKNKKPR